MAWTPAFYFQPTAEDGTTGSYQTVTFPSGVGVAVLDERAVRQREDGVPVQGLPGFANFGVQRVVQVSIEGLTYASHGSFLRKLRSMESAITLGGVCHFTMDHARRGAWALRNSGDSAYVVPALGVTDVYRDYTATVLQDLFTSDPPGGGSLTDTDTTGQGDNLVLIQTEQPEAHAHITTITSISDAFRRVSLTEAWPHQSSMSRAYMRWPYFFPGLTLAGSALGDERVRWLNRGRWRAEFTFEMSDERVFGLFP